jgi:uncharacterized membrane protein
VYPPRRRNNLAPADHASSPPPRRIHSLTLSRIKSPQEPPKEIKAQRNRSGRISITIGVVGLAVTIAINLITLIILKMTAVEFSSHAWWFIWVSSYVVWLSFLTVGVTGLMKEATKKQDQQ